MPVGAYSDMTESGVEEELKRMLNSMTEEEKRKLSAQRQSYNARLKQWMREDGIMRPEYPRELNKLLGIAYLKGLQRMSRELNRH